MRGHAELAAKLRSVYLLGGKGREQLGEAAELLPVGDIRQCTDITLDIGSEVRFEKVTDKFELNFLSFGKKPAPELFGKRPLDAQAGNGA